MVNGHFSKFKKKVWFDIFAKCFLIALASALVLTSAVLLPCKLTENDILWVYYVLIALGGFAAGFGISFACFKTNDKKIAMRLDRELKLDESVQTALEFSHDSGDMPALQREKTAERLADIPARSLRFKGIAVYAVCAVICVLSIVAIPIICVFAPPKVTPEGPPAPPPIHDVTDWEWKALDDLINYVSSSRKADEAAKSGMLTELNGLRNLLLAGVTQNGLETFVQNTATGVRNAVGQANSSASDEQKTLNSEEGDYVVNRLYEIFGLKKPAEDPENPGGDPENPEDPSNPGGGNTGTGDLNLSDVPFFDPELGYIKMGEVRDEYYEKVQNALAQGLISREEWEYIMLTYFGDLSDEQASD